MRLYLVFLSAASLVSAWEAGFWGTNGKNIQAHGTGWTTCTSLKTSIPLGQVTFDGSTPNYPDPCYIVVYQDLGCKTPIYGGCPSRQGKTVSPPATAKSYSVGSNPFADCC
ncbi:hypothetical protein BJ546DRAFT_166880 [Cryomyces antarcticus]